MSSIQSVIYLYNPCPNRTHLYTPYPVCTQSLQLMSRQYIISKSHLHSQYLISTCNAQSIPNIYLPCPASNTSLKLMSTQYPNIFSLCQPIFTVHASRPSRSTDPDQTPSLQHLNYTHLVGIPYILPISSQYTISPVYVQSVNHLSYLLPVSVPPLLPMSCQYTTSAAHGQSVHHLSFPYPFTIPPLLPKSKSSKYTIYRIHV